MINNETGFHEFDPNTFYGIGGIILGIFIMIGYNWSQTVDWTSKQGHTAYNQEMHISAVTKDGKPVIVDLNIVYEQFSYPTAEIKENLQYVTRALVMQRLCQNLIMVNSELELIKNDRYRVAHVTIPDYCYPVEFKDLLKKTRNKPD